MAYRRNARNKIVYVPAPTPASILADRAARAIDAPAPVWLVQHTAPNRKQRRADKSRAIGTNVSYVTTPVAA